MTNFTEQQLKDLGFEEVYVPPEDNDGVNPYTYFTLSIGSLYLISDAFDPGVEKSKVYFFEDEQPLTKTLIKELIKWNTGQQKMELG